MICFRTENSIPTAIELEKKYPRYFRNFFMQDFQIYKDSTHWYNYEGTQEIWISDDEFLTLYYDLPNNVSMEVENKNLLIALIIFFNMKRLPYMKLFCNDILIPDNFFDSIPDDDLVLKLCSKNKNLLVLKNTDINGKEDVLKLNGLKQYYFKKPNDNFSYFKDKEDLRMTKGKLIEIES